MDTSGQTLLLQGLNVQHAPKWFLKTSLLGKPMLKVSPRPARRIAMKLKIASFSKCPAMTVWLERLQTFHSKYGKNALTRQNKNSKFKWTGRRQEWRRNQLKANRRSNLKYSAQLKVASQVRSAGILRQTSIRSDSVLSSSTSSPSNSDASNERIKVR